MSESTGGHPGYPLPISGRRDGRAREVVAYAVVDPDVFEWARKCRWNLNNNGYVVKADGSGLLLARLILGLDKGDSRETDHVHHDKLDNRREVLRIVTPEQNKQNCMARLGSTSRFRGVSRRCNGKWRATGFRDGRQVSIGNFDDELAAALAAERWRAEHMPFAQPDPELAHALAEPRAVAA